MKHYIKNKRLQFLFPFLFLIGIALIVFGFNDEKAIDLKYDENNSIEYNVYLKENPFFETKYLPEGRTYIASLIDYIDTHFHYNITYNKNSSGRYNYKITAVVRANKKEGTGYYWEKEYDLTKEKYIDIKDNLNVSIDDNVRINYSEYNEVINKFKKEYGVDTNGELIVTMKVKNVSNFENITTPVEVNSAMNITIPLLEQSLEVSINKDASSENNILSITEKSKEPMYLILKISGFVLTIISMIGFIIVTRKNINFKRNNSYEIKLNNILSNYDSIIANIKTLPDMSDFNLIEVSTFDEMLDVYNEVRMPINYYQEKNASSFIIINDSIVWRYVLKKYNTKRVDNNEKKASKREIK